MGVIYLLTIKFDLITVGSSSNTKQVADKDSLSLLSVCLSARSDRRNAVHVDLFEFL